MKNTAWDRDGGISPVSHPSRVKKSKYIVKTKNKTNKTKQDKTKQNKTKQNATKQNKTKQNKTQQTKQTKHNVT